MPDEPKRNSNGLFMKVLIGALAVASVSSVGAAIKMYREQGELAAELRAKIDALGAGLQAKEHERRISELEAYVTRVGLEQARRTSRIETLERDVQRNREDIQRFLGRGR